MSAPVLSPSPQPTSWQGIQAELLRRIAERIWQPGQLVPKEVELAREFGCARATVNRAMRELANAGLINRKRKAGTRVAVNPVRKATLDIAVVRLDVESRGAVYRHTLLVNEIVAPTVEISSRISNLPNAKLLRLHTLHYADDCPFMLEERWVNPVAVPEILAADLTKISANEWLVQNAPLTSGDISFSALNASDKEAQILCVDRQTALFIVERQTWLGSLPITSVRLAYAPGFKMQTVI